MTNVPLFVNGDGMAGGSVHHTIAAYPFLGAARTAPRYRFYSVRDAFPALWPTEEGGVAVVGELYDVPLEAIRDDFMAAEPPELELGVIEMEGGAAALAVLLRASAHVERTGLIEISAAADWRAYRGITPSGDGADAAAQAGGTNLP
ncbi:MAG: allophanate hydrolase-related protein [Mycobacteriales bacterium]